MQTLFEPAIVDEIKQRISRLRADSPRQWGTMTPAQMLAHCSAQMEVVLGMSFPPRTWMGRIFGPLAKSVTLGDKPIRHNMPTDPVFVIRNQPDLDPERDRLLTYIDCFAREGREGCTQHPHSFFGRMTSEEWARLLYKHLDHHLRQFGV